MTGNLKKAFDGIRSEDALKTNTMRYLQTEIQRRDATRARNPVRNFAVALASAAVMILLGVFSLNLYFAPTAYVDVDINPSIALTLNQFDRVIGTRAYNADGEKILSALSLKYKNYNGALIDLMDAVYQNGYIRGDSLVSVTVQTDNYGKENELLAGIQTEVTDYITGHHNGAQVDVFPVSGYVRSNAHELEITPAKYLAIQELIEVDPNVSVESCRGHSISEIRQQTQEHTGGHHAGGGAGHHMN